MLQRKPAGHSQEKYGGREKTVRWTETLRLLQARRGAGLSDQDPPLGLKPPRTHMWPCDPMRRVLLRFLRRCPCRPADRRTFAATRKGSKIRLCLCGRCPVLFLEGSCRPQGPLEACWKAAHMKGGSMLTHCPRSSRGPEGSGKARVEFSETPGVLSGCLGRLQGPVLTCCPVLAFTFLWLFLPLGSGSRGRQPTLSCLPS